MQGVKCISVLDTVSIFYQWPVAEEDRHKLTVIFYYNQEIFNICIISFINSIVYIQYLMNNKLQNFHAFIHVYIDDLITHSPRFKKYIQYLTAFLSHLQELNIKLSSRKTFIDFSSVTLLE